MVDAERGGGALADVIDDGDDVAIAAITVAELRVGVQMARGRRREKRERFVAAVVDAVSTIEVYDMNIADAHAALLTHVRRKGTPRGAHDLIIAATARARERQVVSLDRTGFADLPGVSVLR